ncbi:MAG: membrane protein insertase YidC, partial [Holosporaceae bacterium]|nr:membrane protein insertase YidC [Holosporaceae bacterium]
MEEDKRNVLLFFVISVLIMVSYPYFFNQKQANQQHFQKLNEYETPIVAPKVNNNSSVFNQNKVENIKIESVSIIGSISSCGAKIGDVKLKKYKKDSVGNENVSVFGNSDGNYFAITNWVSDNPGIILPNENTCWKAKSTKVTETSPVELTWDNGNGLIFEKHISIDDNFLVTIIDKVKNYGNENVSLKSVMRINRKFEKSSDSFNFYEGPLGYTNGKLEEISYEDLSKKDNVTIETKGGWFGITDKYWLVAFLPNQNLTYKVSYRHSRDSKNVYVIESVDDALLIAPSVEISKTHHLFVGPKEIKTLDMYENKLGVKHFDMAIDFGYLY